MVAPPSNNQNLWNGRNGPGIKKPLATGQDLPLLFLYNLFTAAVYLCNEPSSCTTIFVHLFIANQGKYNWLSHEAMKASTYCRLHIAWYPWDGAIIAVCYLQAVNCVLSRSSRAAWAQKIWAADNLFAAVTWCQLNYASDKLFPPGAAAHRATAI